MKLFKKLKNIKWINILLFYFLACSFTYLVLKFSNVLKIISINLFNFNIPFNWNHGIALLITSLFGYQAFKFQLKTSFFGNNLKKSILFSLIFLITYTLYGISNEYGINQHLWAFIFCLLTLIYNIFEETAWRGFLNDNLNSIPFWLKGIITGVFWGLWHLFVFENFNQFGGLHIFILLCIILSVIIACATDRTNSVLVAASIHALFCKTNYATLICASILIVLIVTWNNDYKINKRERLFK